jgi:ketosteroid isomerase-like protein
VHSDRAANPFSARRHFAVVPDTRKRLIWEGETDHFQFYEDLDVIERTTCNVVDWFGRHLGPGHMQSAIRFFELLGRKDIDAWAELWHPDAQITVPYPPEGFPEVIEGKEQILAGFRGLFAKFESFDAKLTGIYPAADSDAVCVEYRPTAVLADGTEYTNQNIAVFRFDGGLITAYHDYFDPRRFQVVVDASGG